MNKYKFETMQLHVGQESPDSATGARAVPIYATTSYVFPDSADAAARFDLSRPGNVYSRMDNPTSDVLEKRMAALEGGVAAVAFASGTAAIAGAVQNILTKGSHIVAASTLYGGTFNLFAHTLADCGIDATFVQGGDPADFEAAMRPETRLVYIESMGNPNCDVLDIEAIAAVAHAHKVPLMVDNTFGTPYLIRPIEHGADIVVHSTTKFIGGHGSVLGGMVIDGGTFDWAASGLFPGLSEPNENYHGVVFTDIAGKSAYAVKLRSTILRDFGACPSPFSSWILLQGLETLSLRVERHVQNALKAAEYLAKRPEVAKVNHPSLPDHPDHELYKKYFPLGGGAIFTIELRDADKAQKFCESLKLFSLLANVADVKSLVIHPASTTHAQMNEAELAACGISRGTIRLSIGIEHIDDIIADLEQAFEAIKG
jgi:O-acetylhomoserine (thiol)-lyase